MREVHAVRPPAGTQLYLAAGHLRAVRRQGHQGAGEPEIKVAVYMYNFLSVGKQDSDSKIKLTDLVQFKVCSIREACRIYLQSELNMIYLKIYLEWRSRGSPWSEHQKDLPGVKSKKRIMVE